MFSYNFVDGRSPPLDVFSVKEQNVLVQHSSPRVDGKLIIQANPFEFNRRKSIYQDLTYFYPYWNEFIYLTTREFQGLLGEPENASVLYPYIPNLKVNGDNNFVEEIGSIRVNLLDLYRTRMQTVNMVTKNLNKLRFAYLHLKKRRFRQFASVLGLSSSVPQPTKWDNIPSLWLEYSYGWKPLVSDVYTMIDNTFEAPSSEVRKVYRENFTVSDSKAIPGYNDFKGSFTANYELRAVSRALVSVDSPAIYAASQYGITNPAAVAWEAVPWSFVVDWFVPVGTYLELLGATAGLKLSDYSCTCVATVDTQCTMSQRRGINWDIPIGGNTRHFAKVKRRYTGYIPEYSMPPLRGPLDQSLTRFSYALSLLASVMGRKVR